MRYDVAMTAEVGNEAKGHLLQHYQFGEDQEDLCFALWRPSTGNTRCAGLIYRIILPEDDERKLHCNVSFQPGYMARAIDLARQENSGLAFMHSHPGDGWQEMSVADEATERDVLAYPAGATGLPLIGLTVASDGYWSARFWIKTQGEMRRKRCEKVRIVGDRSYEAYFDDMIVPPPERREVLRRTIDTWGEEAQQKIARLKVGVVGVGSVGCTVAEAIARIGISTITVIDHDIVKEHNLDRLLYASESDIGKLKVDLAEQNIRRHATAKSIDITTLAMRIQEPAAYKTAIACDIIFCCVDRPVGRDVLNYIAYAHLIPVIDGGVNVGPLGQLNSAHWRAHVIGPRIQCMRCIGQYNTSMVTMELDGSLDSPSYIDTLPPEARMNNQNVFPFSLGTAGLEVNLMLRYLLAQEWWPTIQQQDYRFVTGDIRITTEECYPSCEFLQRVGFGDAVVPPYLDRRTDKG